MEFSYRFYFSNRAYPLFFFFYFFPFPSNHSRTPSKLQPPLAVFYFCFPLVVSWSTTVPNETFFGDLESRVPETCGVRARTAHPTISGHRTQKRRKKKKPIKHTRNGEKPNLDTQLARFVGVSCRATGFRCLFGIADARLVISVCSCQTPVATRTAAFTPYVYVILCWADKLLCTTVVRLQAH